MPGESDRIWVIDTSSIIEVRRVVPGPEQPGCLRKLGALVEADRLVFPREVLAELERGCEGKEPDARYLWARQHQEQGCRLGTDYERLTKVLERVATVLDTEKTSGAEEADPYVLAMALGIVEAGGAATVVTQEKNDKPKKMSLSTACGLWGIPSVPLLPWLGHLRVWP